MGGEPEVMPSWVNSKIDSHSAGVHGFEIAFLFLREALGCLLAQWYHLGLAGQDILSHQLRNFNFACRSSARSFSFSAWVSLDGIIKCIDAFMKSVRSPAKVYIVGPNASLYPSVQLPSRAAYYRESPCLIMQGYNRVRRDIPVPSCLVNA